MKLGVLGASRRSIVLNGAILFAGGLLAACGGETAPAAPAAKAEPTKAPAAAPTAAAATVLFLQQLLPRLQLTALHRCNLLLPL